MKAPFPWFGGKCKVAPLIWERLGDVRNYVEPFAGSLAVLLERPHKPGVETVNDLDGYIANFWRAIQKDPDAVAHHCDWPVNELDLHARHQWLIGRKRDFAEKLRADPDFCDAKYAGWWVWGASSWIGDCWARDTPQKAKPHLGDAGMGVHRASLKLPHLGDAGRGVHRASLQLPHLGDAGRGVRGELRALADRLRYVRVCCGDWTRIMGESVIRNAYPNPCGIVLDPPYAGSEAVYAEESKVFDDVRAWAIEHGDDLRLRIALCGYDDGRPMPDSWEEVAWKAQGGYGSQGDGDGRANSHRERIWFSPGCVKVARQGWLWA